MKRLKYDLYVGRLNNKTGAIYSHAEVVAAVNALTKGTSIDGATFTSTKGIWNGTQEPSTIVTFIAKRKNHKQVKNVIIQLKVKFEQDAILLVRSAASVDFM